MTNKRSDARGPAFATGGLKRPREDLVEWPPDSKGPSIVDAMPASSIEQEDEADVHAELARAKREIRRLLTRVHELSEENERLRREVGVRSAR
jgi:hypothetical protein